MKITKLTSPACLAFFALGWPAQALASGDIQALLGDPILGGSVQAFAEGSGFALPSTPQLRGLQLLPLDFNGRLSSHEFLLGAPRHRADIAGAGRIELPYGLGVLYRYSRVLAGGARGFGFLRIEPSGATHLLAEQVGTGVLGDQDPFGSRIALSATGVQLLIATTPAAGGNLLELGLLSEQVIDHSATLAPLAILPESMRFARNFAVVVAQQGLYRMGLGAQDQLAAVATEAGTTYYSGQVVLSANATYALTTAGLDATALHAWVLTASGIAVRASSAPQAMSPAGYLPDAPHGPFLAVSNDGDMCAWRTESAVSREVYLRRVSAAQATPAAHITNNTLITDTLDEAGVLSMFQPGKVHFAVGEVGVDPGVGIEKADFFESTVDANGVTTLVNVTATSGQVLPPFQAIPQITPLFMRWLPSAQKYLMFDQDGAGGRLVAFDPNGSGLQTLLANVKDMDFVEQIGDVLILSIRMDTGNKPHHIVRMPADLSNAPVVVFDAADDKLQHAVVDPSGWIAFKQVPDFGLQRLHRYQLATNTVESFPVSATSFGPVIAWTTNGDLAFSMDLGLVRLFVAWPRTSGVPYRLRTNASDGVLLPGK